MNTALRHTVLAVALLNLAYFGVEFAVALSIASVSLLADSVDFLEDASVNLLIFFAIAWAATTRARVGMLLAGFFWCLRLLSCGRSGASLPIPLRRNRSRSPPRGPEHLQSTCFAPSCWPVSGPMAETSREPHFCRPGMMPSLTSP